MDEVFFRGEAHLGAAILAPPRADWVPDNWVPCRLGTGYLGAVSSYEEKINEAGNTLNAVEREPVPT